MEEKKRELVLRTNKGKYGGVIQVTQLLMNLRPSLLSYIRSGWRISCGVAVDFTLSNKPYDDPRSLHAQDMGRISNMNPYEKAIFEVGSALEPYTIDGLFHLMGFGGQPLYMKNPAESLQTSYCWNLNGAPYEDILGGKVKNTAGMLTSYHHAVMQTKMTGPSYFQKIIERFMEIVKCEVKIYP